MKPLLGLSLVLSGTLLLSGCASVIEEPAKYLLERTASRPSFEPYQPTGNEEAMLERASVLVKAGQGDEADRIYHELAQAGYPRALWAIAGHGASNEKIAAYHCYEREQKVHWSVVKLADQGDIDAINFYWDCIHRDSTLTHHTGKGLYYLEYLAEQDNLLALSRLYRYRMARFQWNDGLEPKNWSVRRRHERDRTPDMAAAGKWLTRYAEVISRMPRHQVRYEDVERLNRHYLAIANSYLKLGEYANALTWYQAHQGALDGLLASRDDVDGRVVGEAQSKYWFIKAQIEVARELINTSA